MLDNMAWRRFKSVAVQLADEPADKLSAGKLKQPSLNALISLTHSNALLCPHVPYFVGYGVQKRRLRLFMKNRFKSCLCYDVGIRWKLSGWERYWACKQEVG